MTDEYTLEDEILDIEPYTGAPDFDVSQTNEDDSQEDDSDDAHIATFAGLSVSAQNPRDWAGTLNWYKNHKTTSEIGFNPDGMCLKICRTSRLIGPKYLTAKEAQDHVPAEFRIHNIADLRRGMNIYYDDPEDSNRAGHIVTVLGRIKGFNPGKLGDLLVGTNSVQAGRLTVVRGDYFIDYWGDPFQFGATWLNGVELDTPHFKSKVERFNDGGPVYNLKLLAKAGKNRPKPKLVLDRIEAQIKRLPDNPKLVRVREFKDDWAATRKIDLSLLDAAVREGRVGVVKQVRDEIKRLIESLPDE